MVDQVLYIFKIAFGLIAACSALVAAWFEFRDRWQTDEEREKTRASYGKKWEAIRDSGLLQLPEKAIMSALDAKTRLTKSVLSSMDALIDAAEPRHSWAYFLLFAFLILARAIGVSKIIVYPGIFLVGSRMSLDMAYMIHPRYGWPKGVSRTKFIPWLVVGLFMPCAFMDILLGLDIASAAKLMLIMLPVYMLVFALAIASFGKCVDDAKSWRLFHDDSLYTFGGATAVSFSVTLCSLLIGSLVAPDAWIPQTWQMLLCNVAFDGFTMVATFAILARAVGEKRKYPIPVAILIDVVVAALFACASLWVGLIGTEHALSIQQVLGVLFAKSAEDPASYAFGPYFWAMHTTFLPTLGYLALILLFWIAKLIVLPVAKVLKRGREIDKPHSLMAGLFGFVAAAALVAAAILHVPSDDVPDRSSAAPAQVVEDAA